jgi:hypothetical protein
MPLYHLLVMALGLAGGTSPHVLGKLGEDHLLLPEHPRFEDFSIFLQK